MLRFRLNPTASSTATLVLEGYNPLSATSVPAGGSEQAWRALRRRGGLLRSHLNPTVLATVTLRLAEGYNPPNATSVPTGGFAQLASI